MKWVVLNALGALVWLAGLAMAKGTIWPGSDFVSTASDSHRLFIGLGIGLTGLVVLLWTNLRSPV